MKRKLLIAVTDKRLMFWDKAFMRKRKALTSVPFNKITAVSSVDEGRGLFGATSELVVKTSSEDFEFEFRGGDKGPARLPSHYAGATPERALTATG